MRPTAKIWPLLLILPLRCYAPPPLETGDVPTAEKQSFEWYLGASCEGAKAARSWLAPTMEFVYGISDRNEINLELGSLREDGHYGLNDAVIGTKYLLLGETEHRPGVALSFEVKLPTGDEKRGLGTGEFDYDLRLRTQKTWGRFTAIGNLGYTFVTDPEVDGATTHLENVWFLSLAPEYQITDKTRLLSEVLFESREERGEPNRWAANLGLEHRLEENFAVHAAAGRSLREGARGGPDWRVYVGLVWEFDAPWKRSK